MIWDSVLEEVKGDDNPLGVNSISIRNVKSNELEDLSVDGVFVAIGHRPNTDVFQGKVDLDAEGYIQPVDSSTRTNVPGVFAAGDVRDKVYRQAATAAGMGCMAALDAEGWLAEQEDAVSVAAE